MSKKFYSPSMNGFTDKPGADGVPVSNERWRELLADIYSGNELFSDGGVPSTRVPVVVLTPEQATEIASKKKVRLMQEATSKIELLRDAVEYDGGAGDEKTQLEAWVKYRVLLNRVDPAVGVFPPEPADVA